MKIGVDIDGVLTNLEQYQLDCGSKLFSKYNKKIVNPYAYEITEIYDVSKELENEFWDEYFYVYSKEEPARKHASEIIKKLKEEGHDIIIITARYYANEDSEEGEKSRNTILNWLKEYDIYYDKIVYEANKLKGCIENNVDVMIEDCDKNVIQVAKELPVICFDAKYNRKCNGKNIYRVYSWYDIYDLINGGKI